MRQLKYLNEGSKFLRKNDEWTSAQFPRLYANLIMAGDSAKNKASESTN